MVKVPNEGGDGIRAAIVEDKQSAHPSGTRRCIAFNGLIVIGMMTDDRMRVK